MSLQVSDLSILNLDKYDTPNNLFKIQDGYKNLKSLKVIGSENID